jgi:hypothetical protein
LADRKVSLFGMLRETFGQMMCAVGRPAPNRILTWCLVLGAWCFLPVWAQQPPDNGTEGGGDTIECANLIYAGTKSSVCFSEAFLSTVASETSIKTSRKFKPVKLGEKELFRYPFAVMTGEGSFALTEEERANLKHYLEGGGFLLASAGCSSKDWGDAFVREMTAIFPARSLQEVPMDHAIFRTVFPIKKLDTKGEEAKLLGLTIGGKVVVIYTADGLNDTGTMHGCCCCGGNEIKNAQQVNVNILTYALLQ